jgi:carbonic anhydrase
MRMQDRPRRWLVLTAFGVALMTGASPHSDPSPTPATPPAALQPAPPAPSPPRFAPAPAAPGSQSPATVESDPVLTADAAIALLKEGNERWINGANQNPNIDPARRQRLAAEGQHPFVTVLTCADSRIPLERVFDRGVGDIFAVRVAGNVAGGSEVGTIEYGAEHLHMPLLVVMGHSKCGAVQAAVANADVHGFVKKLIADIEPAVARARRNNPELDSNQLMPIAVKENVWQSVFDLLKASDVCRGLVKSQQLRVIGAVYDLSSGKVEWLGEHPWQGELLTALETQGDAVDGTEHAAEHADEPGH